MEYFAGANAYLGKYIQLHGQVSYIRARQFAFFVNDTTAPAFAHLYKVQLEDKLNIFRAQMQMSYAFQDRVNVAAGFIFNGYNGMKTNTKAWNVLPMEINASAMFKYKNNWTFKGTWWLFSGSYYPVSGGKENKFEGGNDLSLEACYAFRKNLSAFLSLNNIFGQSYQRWYRYPVYGINALAGLQLRF